jgi:23S rRNA (guanosine2251-2'-O)-methyltransferase
MYEYQQPDAKGHFGIYGGSFVSETLTHAINELKAAGVWVIGLDMGGDTNLFDLEVADQAVCLVMGAEGKGLSRLVRERCDAVASIPLLGELSSLNVSAAGALACFEVTRRRLASAPTD